MLGLFGSSVSELAVLTEETLDFPSGLEYGDYLRRLLADVHKRVRDLTWGERTVP